MSNEPLLSHPASAFVLRALQQSSKPLPVSNLAKAIPKSVPISKEDLQALLRQLIETGQIRGHKARSSVYWLPDLEDRARQRILETLSDQPLTKTDLTNKMRSLLVGWPPTKREEMVAQLVKEKRVYRVASLAGNARLFSARAELTPQDVVRLALRLAMTKLRPRGVTSEQVLAMARELVGPAPAAEPTAPAPLTSPLADGNLAPSNVVTLDPGQIILERMPEINPAATTGALVSLAELRRALRAELPDKDRFDQAVLRLAEQGQVALHRHDYVSSLSQEERDALVSDPDGNHFIGIALRM